MEKEKGRAKKGRPKKGENKWDEPEITSAPLSQHQKELVANNFQLPNASDLKKKNTAAGKKQDDVLTAKHMQQMMDDATIIKNYHDNFKHILGPHKPVDLSRASPAEVRALRDNTYRQMDRQFGPQLAKSTVGLLGQFVEMFWMSFAFNHPLNPVKGQYNLTGLGEALRTPQAQRALEPLMMEWQIRYPAIFEQPLWLRTLHTLGQIAHEVAQANQGRPSQADAPPQGFDDL